MHLTAVNSAAWASFALAGVLLASCGGGKAPPAQNAAEAQKKADAELAAFDEWTDAGAPHPRGRFEPKLPPTGKGRMAYRHATIWTAAGAAYEDGVLVVEDGVIRSVGGPTTAVPAGTTVVDVRGKFITPGLIDTHSHIGVYPQPGVAANEDGNESSAPATPAADAAYGYWGQDPAIPRAAAGGITIAQILPGSANLIGGRGIVVEMRPARSAFDVAVEGAPRSLKIACGENPKRVHGPKDRGLRTRMGTYAELRDVFFKALEHSSKLAQYKQDERAWEKKRARAKELGESGTAPKAIAPPSPPGRNEGYETLAAAVRGEILVHVHCYRQDDIVQILAVADEVGFSVRSFHHALEAYKVRDELVRRNVSISTWADWFGFKMEAFDGIPESIALFTQSGGRAIVHSDSPIGIQRLNQEAAKALAVGRAAGIKLTDDDALKWITLHAAWALGIDDRTGSLEPNKRADFVIWDRHPFSTYARPDAVYVRGMATFERAKGMPLTDFELGVGGDDGGAP